MELCLIIEFFFCGINETKVKFMKLNIVEWEWNQKGAQFVFADSNQ